MGFAQNVGIGTNAPFTQLSLHGGTSLQTAISFSNNASGTGPVNSVTVGFVRTGNPGASAGFISLPAGVNFRIEHGAFTRFDINPNGNVGIGMAPYNSATLNVNGYGYFFAKGNQGAFVSASDTGTAITLNGSGFGASKRLSSGLNFINLLMRGDKSQAYIEANFKNGTANQGVSTVVFDSLGRVGIGSYILDSSVNTRLHVYGSQTIQQGILYLHGHRNNYTQGNEIRFQYNGEADIAAGPLSGQSWYSIEQEDADNPTTNRQGAFAIVENYIHPLNTLFNQRYVGFALNHLGQVGLGRYPDKALESEINVDIAGKARINGGLRLTGIGEATGKILVTNASSDATWQNPPKITLDQPSASGQSVIEFRNQGVYVGGFGWSEASSRYFLYDGPTNTNPLLIKNGRIGIGNRESTTNTLEVNGNASKATAGDWLANSDARLKKDIQPLQGALQKLLQLKGITYQWNDNTTGTNRPEGTQMGFTAQNIQQVFPQLVSADAQGFLQTAYGTYDALYVEAIKELLKKIEVLEEKVKALSK
jgi:hypothetical protein